MLLLTDRVRFADPTLHVGAEIFFRLDAEGVDVPRAQACTTRTRKKKAPGVLTNPIKAGSDARRNSGRR